MALGMRARLVGRFREISAERLERLNRLFAQMQERPADVELAIAVKREIHTVKGEARIAGFRVIAHVAHEIEDLLAVDPRTRLHVGAIFAGFRLIQQLAPMAPDIPETEPLVVAWRQTAGAALEGGFEPPLMPFAAEPVASMAPPDTHKREPALEVKVERLDRVSSASADLVARIRRSEETLARLQDELRHWEGDVSEIRPLVDAALARLVDESRALSASAADLEDGLTSLRFVPLSTMFARFPIAVADIAEELGKYVSLEISGGEIELDQRVIDRVGEPLLHLVCNAVDHGVEFPEDRGRADKPVKAIISLQASVSAGQLEVVVSDDGRGIDVSEVRAAVAWRGALTPREAMALSVPEVLDRIFDPEFSTRTDVTTLSGRGVGLAIVRDTVRQLGGYVNVATVQGQSTTFTLRVPTTVASQPQRQSTGVTSSQVPLSAPRGRILVVDDSAFTLELVVEVFERLGFEVIAAMDGREGLDRFEDSPPDLIFTDLDMPVLDGFGLIRGVRSTGSKIPIVVFTTRGATDGERAMALGADEFLKKTAYRERQLHNVVAKYIKEPQ